MFSQLQLQWIILYAEPAVTPPRQFRHYKIQNTGLSEQMNALLPGAAVYRATVQNRARNQEQSDICCTHGLYMLTLLSGFCRSAM
jgi:hypothetical protein